MTFSPVMPCALILTGAVAVWGLVDATGLAEIAAIASNVMFTSRGWFVMLTASVLLIGILVLAFSPYGRIKLGKDEDEPEFSTISWLTMLFAAGMGVGLLFYAVAEPVYHYLVLSEFEPVEAIVANQALRVTNLHWGLHAWAMYGVMALVIAYFCFRRGCRTMVGAPLVYLFPKRWWSRLIGSTSDVLAIYAIAIGLAGSIAMGVFQVQAGLESLMGVNERSATTTIVIFAILCICYVLPLTVDLGKGMALLSNIAMSIAAGLMIFVLLVGPTHIIMSSLISAFGDYVAHVIPQGFQTFTFFDEKIGNWFEAWTLNYMVWWLAWSPFVGVFIARISKGRTIREFVLGVVFVPTLFSIAWFGIFGSYAFAVAPAIGAEIMEVVQNNIDRTTFVILSNLPLALLSQLGTIIAAFLFIVTSVVSGAFVLAMFSSNGDLNPAVRTKMIWGAILGALGLVMILSGSITAVRTIIALSALPFVYIVLLLFVCLLKALKQEKLT